MQSNPESFSDGLPKKSRRANSQRNWRGNKKEYQTKKKRLVVAERTKFLEIRQHPNESIVQFVHQLKERARYCEFERLGIGEMTTEDELIMLRLIEGIHNLTFKHKLLETLQSISLTVETCIEFVQQLELIKKNYNQQPNKEEVCSTSKYKILCKYCGESHVREK